MNEKPDLAGQRSRLKPYDFEALSAHPAIEAVARMIIIPFVSGQCVMIRQLRRTNLLSLLGS